MVRSCPRISAILLIPRSLQCHTHSTHLTTEFSRILLRGHLLQAACWAPPLCSTSAISLIAQQGTVAAGHPVESKASIQLPLYPRNLHSTCTYLSPRREPRLHEASGRKRLKHSRHSARDHPSCPTSLVAWDQSIRLSGPQFSHLKDGGDYWGHLTGLQGLLSSREPSTEPGVFSVGLSASGEPSLQDLWENQGSAVKGSDPLTPNKGVLSVKNAALAWNVFQD